jgi:hypothetical protein
MSNLKSIRLNPGKRSAQAVTRLGGRPNLPKEIPWPVREDGQPLSFVAQLDLSALPEIRNLPLPKVGSLFFFYDVVEMPWGFDPNDRGCSQVIYAPSSLAASGLRAPHRDLDEEGRFKGLSLAATVETTQPGADAPGPVHRVGATPMKSRGHSAWRHTSFQMESIAEARRATRSVEDGVSIPGLPTGSCCYRLDRRRRPA